MSGKNGKCKCGEAEKCKCPSVADMVSSPYWCKECERPSPEKRCPTCGLKAVKIRGQAMSESSKK
jgi:hypothetical protein